MDRTTHASPTVAAALAAWDELEAIHDSEHFADIDVDCAICRADCAKLGIALPPAEVTA